ncbi:MAG TPA: tripartite tricarboxylate transporter substrate binding protein [Burkholderiales bacterium]|nr:tripartite tricarboxylate transporter substrate binding protein [Burkholderiales bacterium]
MKASSPRLALCALAAACAAGITPAHAQDASRFPAKPIRLIVPFPPGGSNDILGRFIAQKMSERLPQQTIVDNRPGADGLIGTELASRAPADGHTLLIVSTSFTQNPAIHKVPFDPVKSFAPVAQIAAGANVICSHPSFAAKTVKDLIALARAKPGDLRYASSGIGGFNHFGGELFNQLAKVKLAHIPYKGGGPAMLDVMTGQVEVVFGTLIQALPHIRSGKLKPLGVGSAKRSPVLSQVPAISETVPGYEAPIWWGVLAPAGVPGPIVSKLNGEINAILRDPDMAKRLSAEAAEPVIGPPEAFGKVIANDLTKWSRIAKEANIRAE